MLYVFPGVQYKSHRWETTDPAIVRYAAEVLEE
jgi:hypothetical protein